MKDVPHVLPNIPKGISQLNRQSLPYEPVCAVFRRYLHGEKLKFTPERAMILDAVLRKTGLFEAEQLAVDLRQLAHRDGAGRLREPAVGRHVDALGVDVLERLPQPVRDAIARENAQASLAAAS